jgi:hypothetical protein
VFAAVLVVAAVLAATADERLYGLLTDGRMAVRTAVSMATLGEIGIARGEAVAVDRPGGDSVTRYGMGAPLLLVLPALAAGAFESAFGAGASQTLFVLLQILLIAAAAAAAGALARGWGGDARAAKRAVFAAGLGSPLFAYASSDFSEPLQAALAGAVFASAAWAVRAETAPRRALWLSAAAGASAGFALVVKSVLVVLLPLALALLLSGDVAGRRRRLLAAAAGGLPLVAVWGAFEVVRFGKPFASYAGERFTHPLLDGLWRLTVGPNKGLLLYFPLVVLSVVGAVRLAKGSPSAAALGAAYTGFVLATAAAWWAWDGTFGWGPRLLLSAIPVLAAFAALASASLPPLAFRVLFGLGVGVNAIGVLSPPALTMWYLKILPKRELTEAEAARYPSFALDRESVSGKILLDHQFGAATEPALSPLVVAPWLLGQSLRGGGVLARLATPPWPAERPELRPAALPSEAIPAESLGHLTAPFRWPHLGMSLVRKKTEIYWALAYLEGLLDQANRAQDMRRADRAVDFAERFWSRLPNMTSAVALAESYRIAGRREMLQAFAPTILSRRGVDPRFRIVLALFARDFGDEGAARELVAGAVSGDARPEYRRLLDAPLAEWPATFRDVTGENRKPRA